MYLSRYFEPSPNKNGSSNILIGISCWFFSISTINTQLFIPSTIISLCSFMGDFYFRYSYWSVIDRWLGTFFSIFIFASSTLKIRFICIASGVLLMKSIRSKNNKEWVFYHFLWHFLSSYCLFLYSQKNESLLNQTTSI